MGNQSAGDGDPGDDGRARWQRRYDTSRLRDSDFTTLSGLTVDPVYGPADGAVVPGFERIGWPGEYPFTRGLYSTGYRGRTWTIRQFSGFGNAVQTNQRYKMLLQAGGGGLSVAFDMPTLMGRDSDDPRSAGEVGHCGVAIDSAADMDVLFCGIPLGEITTSMTIRALTWASSTARCRRTSSRSTSRRRSGCSRRSRT
jgi:methylmalonyl-CoA mutase N-terminal domain/subunit